MIISLSEIPDEGKHFSSTEKSGEFKKALGDLIKKHNYKIDFFIKPIGKGYDLSGSIKTFVPELCYRCGQDFDFGIDATFHEIMLSEEETGTITSSNHFNDLEQENPNVVLYSGNIFDMGEYVHELIGLQIPMQPAPIENEKGDCSLCGIQVRGKDFSYNEDIKKNPFDALKGIKVKS